MLKFGSDTYILRIYISTIPTYKLKIEFVRSFAPLILLFNAAMRLPTENIKRLAGLC